MTIWLILLVVYVVKGQSVVIPGNSRYNDTSGGRIADLPMKTDSSIGEVYWFNLPQKGKICLPNGDSILNKKVNIRLDKACIEIYDGLDIRVLPLGLTYSLSIGTKVFVTQNYFDNRYNLPAGYYEVLLNGYYSLVAHLTYEVQKQNYNAQFDVGNTSAKAFKGIRYFVLRPDFKTLELTDMRKKIACSFFTDPQRSLEYLKNNKIRFKNDDDLIKWITYENTLSF